MTYSRIPLWSIIGLSVPFTSLSIIMFYPETWLFSLLWFSITLFGLLMITLFFMRKYTISKGIIETGLLLGKVDIQKFQVREILSLQRIDRKFKKKLFKNSDRILLCCTTKLLTNY